MGSQEGQKENHMNLQKKFIALAEKGILPDFLIRMGIRRLCRKRLQKLHNDDCEKSAVSESKHIREADLTEVAPVPRKANEQHYEVPANFYKLVLGPNLKYSCCLWEEGTRSLAEAEEHALATTCKRASLENGQSVLELGCGWGSLSLWMAKHYPDSEITSVSNSNSQREFIESKAKERGIQNLTVLTDDINRFNPKACFDRVVSVEMFEHVCNHRELFQRIDSWLNPGGLLFTHVFCHRTSSYRFLEEGEDDWMAKYFFSGGTMPGDSLFLKISGNLRLQEQNRWSGMHYARTAEAWLENIDNQKTQVLKTFQSSLDEPEAKKIFHRWRIFFLACAETFAFAKGQEWWVSHYLFRKN
jgi:cyclopropane-fatty-acyl-phospholipid synthase